MILSCESQGGIPMEDDVVLNFNTDFIEMVKYAIKAPSGHNTQPWKFKFTENSIEIIPDFTKSLPIVDKSNREFYISLGCALENLCITAQHLGYNYKIVQQNGQGIIVNLEKSGIVNDNELFFQIEKRQTNRSIYKQTIISNEIINNLKNIAIEPNTQVYFAKIGEDFADLLTQYILKGNEIQMNDEEFRNELIFWMRFNKEEIRKTNDGLTYKAMGFPSIPRFLGRPIVGGYLKPKKQNETDLEKINSSSHFVLFTTKDNSISEWINLGRSLQRILLETTRFEISNAYLNPPCEIEAIAKEIQEILPINNEYPTLLLRIGYAEPMPYSPRKSIKEIMVE
jgi:hypothetical protein